MIDKEKTALFIGNRDCYQVKEADIERAIISVIENGITIFLNGGQGYFDKTCAVIVHRLKKTYPHILLLLILLHYLYVNQEILLLNDNHDLIMFL